MLESVIVGIALVGGLVLVGGFIFLYILGKGMSQ